MPQLPTLIEIAARRYAYRLTEILAEEGGIGEIEDVAYLLDGILPTDKHCFGIEDDMVANPVKRTATTALRHHYAEILGSNGQAACIV